MTTALLRLGLLTAAFTVGLARLGIPVSLGSVIYAAALATTFGLIISLAIWLFGDNS